MNKFKSLGVLDDAQKKVIWQTKLSGSQIRELIANPTEVYRVKKGIVEKPDLNEIPGLANKLAMGNYMEPVIIKAFEDFHGLEVKTTKETFQSTSNDLLTANIDGYIGRDINDIDYIVEVKNTKIQDTAKLINTYIHQLDYYMKFFNAKKGGKFFFFVDGWETKLVTIERSTEREAALEITIEEFQHNLENDIEPEEFGNAVQHIEIEGLEDKVDRFKEVKEQIKELKKEEEILKTDIESEFKEDVGFAYGNNYQIKRVASKRKGTVNYSKIAFELAEKHGEDILEWQEKYTSKGYETYRMTVSKLKKKD